MIEAFNRFNRLFLYFQDVKFPLNLDVYELCSPELKTKLKVVRDKFQEEEEKVAEKVTNTSKRWFVFV